MPICVEHLFPLNIELHNLYKMFHCNKVVISEDYAVNVHSEITEDFFFINQNIMTLPNARIVYLPVFRVPICVSKEFA